MHERLLAFRLKGDSARRSLRHLFLRGPRTDEHTREVTHVLELLRGFGHTEQRQIDGRLEVAHGGACHHLRILGEFGREVDGRSHADHPLVDLLRPMLERHGFDHHLRQAPQAEKEGTDVGVGDTQDLVLGLRG